MKMDPNEMTPDYVSLEEANKEIRRLQQALFNDRTMYWKKIEKLMLDIKSLKGQLKTQLKGD